MGGVEFEITIKNDDMDRISAFQDDFLSSCLPHYIIIMARVRSCSFYIYFSYTSLCNKSFSPFKNPSPNQGRILLL